MSVRGPRERQPSHPAIANLPRTDFINFDDVVQQRRASEYPSREGYLDVAVSTASNRDVTKTVEPGLK